MNIQSTLEGIEFGNGINAFQVVFWLLIAWACWAFYAYFGDKLKPWVQSWLTGVAEIPKTAPRGIDALHAMLTANGWTPEEADKLVAENVTRIRTANEAAK